MSPDPKRRARVPIPSLFTPVEAGAQNFVETGKGNSRSDCVAPRDPDEHRHEERRPTELVGEHAARRCHQRAPHRRNLRDGIRLSTAIGYLAPARHRLTLTIRGGCRANRAD